MVGLEGKRVLGVGRWGFDSFHQALVSHQRLGTKKISTRFIGQQLSGSVGRIISCLASLGCDSQLIVREPLEPGEETLLRKLMAGFVISAIYIGRSTVPSSYVLLDDAGHVQLIATGEELEEHLILPHEIPQGFLRSRSPDIVVSDARQLALSTDIFQQAVDAGIPTFLDPGSTRSASNGEALSSLIDCSTYLCCGLDFIQSVLRSDVSTVARASRCSDKHLIVSMPSGEVMVANSTESTIVQPKTEATVGNSMGAGDVFRGVLVSGILLHDSLPTFEDLVRLAESAILGAQWKISSGALLPELPNRQQIRNWLSGLP